MMRHRVRLVKIVCGLAAVCWVPATGSPGHWATAWAAVPHLVRYQGQAVDAQGIPLQGPYTMTFRLYDADTAGAVVWQEVQANVPINKGHFSVLLGSVTSLNMDWTKTLWLSVQVGTDPELLPRQRITSVPLAIRAEVAEGLSSVITPSLLSPQGSGSGLDADMVDGKHATDLLNRANHTGTQPSSTITGAFAPSVISPQGSGSGLNADLLDGQDVSAFAASSHAHPPPIHSCVNRMGLPGGQSGNSYCGGFGEWCVHNLTAGGRDTESCTTANPGFGDWGAVCCR